MTAATRARAVAGLWLCLTMTGPAGSHPEGPAQTRSSAPIARRPAPTPVAGLRGRAVVPEGAESTAPVLVLRGPYLQSGAPDHVTVLWRTDLDTDGVVRYGLAPESLSERVGEGFVGADHAVVVAGLSPGTRYFYSVGTPDATIAGGDSTYTFVTAPVPGRRQATRVWVIGDSGQPGAGQRAVRDAYRAFTGDRGTDLWLMLGDNAYTTGTDAEYQAGVFDAYPELLRRTVLWPARGNHDLRHGGAHDDYYEIFTLPTLGECGGVASGTEAYYAFDHANVHFVCLDSFESSRLPGSPMLTWLAQDLAANLQDWTIAFWHHPPYSKGSHDSDTEAALVEMREYALPILEEGGVDLVLCGHSHSYERSFLLDAHYGHSSTLVDSNRVDDGDGREPGDGAYEKPSSGPAPHEGCVYAVAGSSSRLGGGDLDHPVMVASMNVLGSLVIDVDGERLDARFLDDAGAVRDAFSIRKGDEVPTLAWSDAEPPVAGVALDVGPVSSTSVVGFTYALPREMSVRLDVYDVAGRRVATLVDTREGPGVHTVGWSAGVGRGSGLYFARLVADGNLVTRRVLVIG